MKKAEKIRFDDNECKPGVDRAEWHGGPFTVVRYTYAPGSVFPEHSHQASQITVVLTGEIEFKVDGEKITVRSGETVYIPGNAPHSAIVPEDSEQVVSINVFNPPREDHP